MIEREPHAVPRGLLRFYILKLLTEKPMKGYEVITRIEERTMGIWKPGPGSIYPMIESLRKEGLIQAASPNKKRSTQRRGTTLQITEKGREILSKFRENVKCRMDVQTLNIGRIWAELVFPGVELADVYLGGRRREIERLGSFLADDYWSTISSEKKKKFFEAYIKITQEELDFVKKRLNMIK
nr:PadR family transcriptional regulator [Candidatus Njordarchaeota archaeon]